MRGLGFSSPMKNQGPKKNGAGFPEFPRPARQLVPRIPPPGALRVTPAAPVVTPVVTPCSGMVGWDGT